MKKNCELVMRIFHWQRKKITTVFPPLHHEPLCYIGEWNYKFVEVFFNASEDSVRQTERYGVAVPPMENFVRHIQGQIPKLQPWPEY